MATKNCVMTITIDEDQLVSDETRSAGTFEYMWELLEGVSIGYNSRTKEQVIEQLDEFVKGVKTNEQVDQNKFDKVVTKFKESLNNIERNEGNFIVVNSWSVEYDINFSVLYSVF